jgi:hypothetical protein
MLIVRETFSNEVFASIGDLRLGWKYDFSCIQNRLILQDSLLGFVMAERLLTEKDFEEDHSDTPNVHLKR